MDRYGRPRRELTRADIYDPEELERLRQHRHRAIASFRRRYGRPEDTLEDSPLGHPTPNGRSPHRNGPQESRSDRIMRRLDERDRAATRGRERTGAPEYAMQNREIDDTASYGRRPDIDLDDAGDDDGGFTLLQPTPRRAGDFEPPQLPRLLQQRLEITGRRSGDPSFQTSGGRGGDSDRRDDRHSRHGASGVREAGSRSHQRIPDGREGRRMGYGPQYGTEFDDFDFEDDFEPREPFY